MKIGSAPLLVALNRVFPQPTTPALDRETGLEDWEAYARDRADAAQRELESTYETLVSVKGERVLDVGSAQGGQAIRYAQLGASMVIGVDIDREFVNFAGRCALDQTVLASFVLGDAGTLPFKSGTFGVVFLNDVVEHMVEPAKVLAESLRVLEENGRLVVQFPPYYSRWGAHLAYQLNTPWCPLFFSERSLIKGAQIVEMRRYNRVFPWDSERYFSQYVNKMTLFRFFGILKSMRDADLLMIRPAAWFPVAVHPLKYLPGFADLVTDVLRVVLTKRPGSRIHTRTIVRWYRKALTHDLNSLRRRFRLPGLIRSSRP